MTYTPKILNGVHDIANMFGVSPKTVRSWIREGAPVIRLGENKRAMYIVETMALYEWLENWQEKQAAANNQAPRDWFGYR